MSYLDGGSVAECLERLRTSLGEDILAQVVEHYRCQGPELVAAICHNVEMGDLGAVCRDAHDLTGIAGVLGATPLKECCSTLQAQAQAGDQLGCSGRLGALESCHRLLLEILDSVILIS